MLCNVIDSATLAFRHLKSMEKLHSERYRAMCPRDDLTSYILHAESVDRLFTWGLDYVTGNPTLAPQAKLPSEILHFRVDQRAYNEFAMEYVAALERYLSGSYLAWRELKAKFEQAIPKAGFKEASRQQFLVWWKQTFLVEMAKWEDSLPGLLLPPWEQVVDDVYFAILERVEIANSSVHQFYIATAATTA